MKQPITVLGFLGGLMSAVAGATAAQPLNTPFQIYMQADGDTECHLDKMVMNDCGLSPSWPVRTLSQVQAILAKKGAENSCFPSKIPFPIAGLMPLSEPMSLWSCHA
jgi:hypothetical protein